MEQVSLSRIARVFAWISGSSIGGGRIALFFEHVVERLKWMSSEEFLPGLALSQVLPGPTVTNLAVYLGHALRGVRGAAVGLVAVLVPGVAVMTLLSALYFSYGANPSLKGALSGMGAAVASFVCVITGRMALGVFRARGRRAVLVAALTLVGVAVLRLNPFLVLGLTGALSLWLNRPSRAAAPVLSPAPGPETPP